MSWAIFHAGLPQLPARAPTTSSGTSHLRVHRASQGDAYRCERRAARERDSMPGFAAASAPPAGRVASRVRQDASTALPIECGQECVGDRSPPTGIEPQQVAVARNTVEKLEARAAAGCGECLMVFA